MKRIRISLAALTFVLAIAGVTTAQANKTNKALGFCSQVDPNGEICLNEFPVECCEEDFTHEPINIKNP